MTPSQIHPTLTVRARLGESPLWDATAQILYWVDIYNHRVHKFNPNINQDLFFDVGNVVGCIALDSHPHRIIMALRHGLAFLDTGTGLVTPIMEVEADKPDNRFNDGKCDGAGRFWFGSMSRGKPEASLYRYDPDGSLQIMETGLTVSNGIGWSPDQKTFYLTDSAQQSIYAYDFELDSGSISDRRILVDLTSESFYPDGLSVDSQGYLWSVMWDGWCVIRFAPSGKEVSRIQLPVKRPTCCTFGGQDLQTLYITSASVGLSEPEIEESFYSGDLFAVPTGVAGLPAYTFRT